MNITLDRLTNEVLTAPLSHALAHRAVGGSVIGFISSDVPVELISAAGAAAVGLSANTGSPTPRADAYLEASFAPLERSIAEQWLRGDLRFLSHVVLSRARDSSQRLYYYISELQRRGLCPGPAALLYDLAKIDRPISHQYTLTATQRLADLLGSDPDKLPDGVRLRNQRRQLFMDLQQLRSSDNPPAGSFVERVIRASDQCDAGRFDRTLSEWLRTIPSPGATVPLTRVALVGSMPAYDQLHLAVEKAGGTVVVEYGDHASSRLGDPIAVTDNILESLATHYWRLRYGPRTFGARVTDLLSAVREFRVQAVVFWLLEEEEALIWDLPAQLAAVTAASIPALVLTRRRWDYCDDSLGQIRSFVMQQQAPA